MLAGNQVDDEILKGKIIVFAPTPGSKHMDLGVSRSRETIF